MNQEKAEKIPVAASEPYPPIKVEGKNHHYAQLLGRDLASSWGEMSAIYGYLYQHWILNNPQAALQTVLFRIAKVEMHHLNILGQLIRMLGGDPKCMYSSGHNPMVWNGNMVNYNKGIRQILSYDIVSEQSAADGYLKQAQIIKDPHVSAMLRRLAQDELIHRDIFSGFLKEIGVSK